MTSEQEIQSSIDEFKKILDEHLKKSEEQWQELLELVKERKEQFDFLERETDNLIANLMALMKNPDNQTTQAMLEMVLYRLWFKSNEDYGTLDNEGYGTLDNEGYAKSKEFVEELASRLRC